MRRVVTEEEHPVDLYTSESMSIQVAKHPDGYRVWIHEKEKGLMVRAYRVKELHLDLDSATRDAQKLRKIGEDNE